MTMKIVVLDGYTLNPGDLSWDRLKEQGDVTIYEHTPLSMIMERAKDAEILFTNKTPLGREQFEQLSKLKYIGVLATGYNVVDVETAKERDIVVTNIPTYGTASVAQMVFALLLELTQHVQHHSDAVHEGKWSQNRDFCFWEYPLVELANKTMGIIGFGRIGKAVAVIAQSFGMKVLAYDNNPSSTNETDDNFKWVTLEELMRQADVVSLHCPLFEQTKGMINKNTLGMMKRSAFLINTSRGPLIVEEELAQALNSGRIAGAGLDVLSVEPPKGVNPLLSAKNCYITPHISWATQDARARLMEIAIDNLKAYLEQKPMNVVN